MVLYERRAFGGGSSQRRPPPFAPAPGPSFLRPAFPQDDVLRPAPLHQPPPPRANQDRAAAADNLLSLIQSARPRGSYEGGPRGREESGSTSEDQTPPLGRGRKRQELQELQELNSSPIIKKKRPGRPAKPVREEDMQDGDQPKRKRRDKKPTYIVRKEKKAMLEAELVQLKQQVLQLRRASGIPDAFFMEKERLIAKAQDNDRLRAESRKQDMLLRNAHAILSAEYLMKRSESPIETFIHLTGDLKQRRAALVDIREMKLKQADDFITERSKFLPQISHWCQENKFESEEGHFYAEKMDNTPFHGARSVRQVFEALQFFFRNMEISISEMLGDITVREDDDSTASNSFSNHRLVSTMAHGVKVEKNIVKFFQLVEPDVDDDNEGSASYALVSTDSVDLDDMYPYVPDERIRMDINAAMKFTEHFCKKPPNRKRKTRTRHPLYGNGGFPYQQDPEEEEEAEDDEFERVVVLTRFFRVKLHHTEMDIPPHVLQEIRQGLACFSDTMVRSMHRVIFESL
ncbi:hypothetical protein PHYSODRAFT_246855 [Phytophthora sojae]|uniref:Uncharacterized protein n=1 Tax=Phytophthora sojae (strain P6497) TaxID=1094619 RepID=G4ZYX9_PHYSP|nr:hypothetical protein PHYSODRAFT_246855 [Phytophthora sojae]EGZ12162.1 hypothetical protein PHYSODRAFT_246855 [Phytophthora sojae]|eukprot:XP_009532495.1 hypothetical protein PHYSODRAFT_246855 [Phytophthora sojae]